MHVVRQNNPPVYVKRVGMLYLANDYSQKVDAPDQKVIVLPSPQVDRKKPRPSGTIGLVVVRHSNVFPDMVCGAIRCAIAPYTY
jgi:hypothetical protein